MMKRSLRYYESRHCRVAAAVTVALCAMLLAGRAAAHTGPPYMIMPEATLDGRTVSVWADPDIGVSRVFVVFEGNSRKVTPP